MHIYFKQNDSANKRHCGLLPNTLVSDVESIYWGVDELGFDPYSLVFTPVEASIPAMCWLGIDPTLNLDAEDLSSDDDDSDFELSSPDRLNLSDRVAKSQDWYKFSNAETLIKCDAQGEIK